MKFTSVCCLALVVLGSVACADHHEEGFLSLFDGTTLNHWDGKAEFWSVKDGAITGQTTQDNPTKGNTFLIWRGGTVDDFELRLKFKIVGGNSGIQYRSKDLGNHVVGGYQGDFEAGDTFSGILYEEKGRGVLAQRGQLTHITAEGGRHKVNVVASLGDTNEINKVIKKEDWNDYQIIAHGNHLMHIINGRVTVQVVDADKRKTMRSGIQTVAGSGILALQLHAGPPMMVQFKDIRIKPMKGINASGDWDIEVDINGNTGTPKFSLTSEGGKVTGGYDGLFGLAEIEGTQKGNEVEWSFDCSYNGNDFVCVYRGTVVDYGTMKGTMSINEGAVQGTWIATKN